MDMLPPHLKHKILSLDPSLLSAAYGDKKKEEKGEKGREEVHCYPSLPLLVPSLLHFLSPSHLSSLEKEGYLVVDHFMGNDAMARCKVLKERKRGEEERRRGGGDERRRGRGGREGGGRRQKKY